MSIKLNDNIKINAGKPSESKYLSSGNTAYVSVSDAITGVPISERHLGLTVNINNIEYWWKDDVQDVDLVEKKFSSEQVVGDFITGATNLGYFSGQTGIQRLSLTGFLLTYNINYYSEYNYYYSDAAGVIRLGSPEHDGPLRRAYVDATRTKSWIYDVGTQGWALSDSDVSANVGNLIVTVPYDGPAYTETEWITGYQTNGFTGIDGLGSLNSGDTHTVGNPVYSYKANQDLNFNTLISDTPEFLKITNDDNFIHFSGTSSVTNGKNYGTGVGIYSGKTGTELMFRTFKQSGDTTLTTQSDGTLIIYSSSDGSAESTTGVTNQGGGAGIYSGTTDRNLYFRTLVGSGDTIVTESGDTIIIGSSGVSKDVFTEDITVSIAGGKTFGKYENGDVIPASGKTSNEVILLSLAEALDPTVNLSHSASGTDVSFGLINKTVNVTFSYVINTIGASVATAVLEWRRGGTGSWVELTSDTGDTSYLHIIDDTANRFNTEQINYQYTVTDSAGASSQTTYDVTPQPYQAPSIAPTYTTLIQSYETQQLREIGNVGTTIAGAIASNRSLVNLTEYSIERDDGSGYVVVDSETGFDLQSKSITQYIDNAADSNATSISYKIVVTDEWTTTTSIIYPITLRFSSYFGYSTNTVLTAGQIVALGGNALLTSRVRTVDPVTAAANYYTYESYPASFGEITLIMQNNNITIQTSTSGAFYPKLSDVVVTNYYGKTVNNIVYKSNAPEAFDGDKLEIS